MASRRLGRICTREHDILAHRSTLRRARIMKQPNLSEISRFMQGWSTYNHRQACKNDENKETEAQRITLGMQEIIGHEIVYMFLEKFS